MPGHPLHHRGLDKHGSFEVYNSSWIDAIVEMNCVSFPKTKKGAERHFIFIFHDSALECIAENIKAELPPYSPRFQKVYAALTAWDKIE